MPNIHKVAEEANDTEKSCRTPVIAETLLHAYYRDDPHPGAFTKAVREAYIYLKLYGLVEPTADENVWKTTPRGDAHVRMLCDLPFPRQVFVDQNGREIVQR